MSKELQFDYLQLNKDILIHLFEKKNIDFVSQYFAENIEILGLHSQQSFHEGLIQHKHSLINYKIIDDNFHIILENDNSCVLEGMTKIRKNRIYTFNINFTMVYEILNDKVFLTHLHFSYPDSTIQDIINGSSLAGLCSYYCDDNLSLRSVNDTLISMLGYTKEEFLNIYNDNTTNLVYEKDRTAFIKSVKECIDNGNVFHVEYRIVKKDGTLIWVMEQGEIFKDMTGNIYINSFISDITFLKKSELELAIQKQKYSLALKDNSITILEYDVRNDRVIIDIQEEEKKKIYDHYLDYVASERSTVFDEDKHLVIDLFKRKIPGPIEIREHIRGTDEFVIKSIDSIIVNDDTGNPAIVFATAKDITKEWNHKAILEKKVQYDALTHVLNFEGAKLKVEDYLLHRSPQDSFSFLLLDIDHFKNINDTYGHLFGNEVLVSFSQCLTRSTRESDIVARVGGDEFIILLKGINKIQTLEKVKSICQSIRNITLRKNVKMTTSIGVYVAEDGMQFYNYKQLINNADLALYQVKKQGRDNYQLYNDITPTQNSNT